MMDPTWWEAQKKMAVKEIAIHLREWGVDFNGDQQHQQFHRNVLHVVEGSFSSVTRDKDSDHQPQVIAKYAEAAVEMVLREEAKGTKGFCFAP
jgi:hypothetical protein